MLLAGALLLNGLACRADDSKLSASSRQMLDQTRHTDTRLKSTTREVPLRLLLQCDASATEADLLAAGARSCVPLGHGFYTVQTDRAQLDQLLQQPFVLRAELSRQATPSLDQARSETFVNQVQSGESLVSPFTGRGVVLGFVDSGFDVAHPAFRSAEGDTLRIVRFWNQMNDRLLTTRESILAEGTDNTEQTHGTHVAGIAGGGYFGPVQTSATTSLDRNPYYGVAYDARLVMVGSTLEDTDILNGIQYIFSYADSIGCPAVVNISLNTSYGPHDGTSLFDQAIDALVGKGHILVGSIGNDAKNKAHASMELTDSSTPVRTYFKPTGYESNTFEAWGQTDGFAVTLSLTDSQGAAVWSCTADGADQSFAVPDDYNYSEGGEIACYTELWNGSRRMYRIALNNLNLKGYNIEVSVEGQLRRYRRGHPGLSHRVAGDGRSRRALYRAHRQPRREGARALTAQPPTRKRQKRDFHHTGRNPSFVISSCVPPASRAGCCGLFAPPLVLAVLSAMPLHHGTRELHLGILELEELLAREEALELVVILAVELRHLLVFLEQSLGGFFILGIRYGTRCMGYLAGKVASLLVDFPLLRLQLFIEGKELLGLLLGEPDLLRHVIAAELAELLILGLALFTRFSGLVLGRQRQGQSAREDYPQYQNYFLHNHCSFHSC